MDDFIIYEIRLHGTIDLSAPAFTWPEIAQYVIVHPQEQ